MAGQKCDHRLKNKKYTIPLPYSRDVGWLKDILRWPSQQKNKNNFLLFAPPIHPGLLGRGGLNLALGLVTSSCSCQIA